MLASHSGMDTTTDVVARTTNHWPAPPWLMRRRDGYRRPAAFAQEPTRLSDDQVERLLERIEKAADKYPRVDRRRARQEPARRLEA